MFDPPCIGELLVETSVVVLRAEASTSPESSHRSVLPYDIQCHISTYLYEIL